MSMNAAAFGRCMLVANGVLLAKVGIEYLIGSRTATARSLPGLANLFRPQVFETGAGVALLTPFLGCAYLTVSCIDLTDTALFRDTEAGIVALATGLVFHLGMAMVRLAMPPVSARLYQPGKAASASKTQAVLGVLTIAGAVALLRV